MIAKLRRGERRYRDLTPNREHLGLPVDLPTVAPARSTEWLPVWSD